MKTLALAAILPLFAIATPAPAILLDPGQTATPNSVQFPDSNETPADVDQFGIPKASAVALSLPNAPGAGGYFGTVYRNTTTGAITTDFHLDFTTPLPLQSITLKGYGGYSVDAAYSAGSAFAPTSVSRSADGGTITFDFTNSVSDPNFPPYAGSFDLVLLTDATSFTRNTTTLNFVNDGDPAGFSINNSTYAPAGARLAGSNSPVPEPASLSLLALATAGLVVRFRRRR